MQEERKREVLDNVMVFPQEHVENHTVDLTVAVGVHPLWIQEHVVEVPVLRIVKILSSGSHEGHRRRSVRTAHHEEM